VRRLIITFDRTGRARLGAALAAFALIVGGAGYYFGSSGGPNAGGSGGGTTGNSSSRKVLYWYDPMVPQEKYDHNGLSSMGMQTVPKYADEGGGEGAQNTVRIDPDRMQNLGIRIATATMGQISARLDVPGTIDFNQRNVAVVQARASGFVQRVYGRAPGDIVGRDAPIVDLLAPEWTGAQREFLAVRGYKASLTEASRQRMRLLGMPEKLISRVERTGRVSPTTTVTTPVGGAIQTLDARAGMTVSMGQTLAQVTSLDTVWLNGAVPEAQAGEIRLGQWASANIAAFPGMSFGGRVVAVLPTAQSETRTITFRIELSNPRLLLRPGMFATVHLDQAGHTSLLVPSESVIRTGKRTLVILALLKGRYQPAEVNVGREENGQTEILAGLSEGEKVVTSGQFLIDSEATLTGIPVRKIGAPRP
jgi:Cu(I)/Ag(I) efflux system membrane fusion protein